MIQELPEVAMRRRLRRRRRGRKILNILLLILILAAAFMFLRSPVFEVQDVEIIGLDRLSAAEVLDWSGLRGPLLVWEVDTTEVARRLAANPVVLGVEVKRDWPDRLIIHLQERSPVAVFKYFDMWALVDEDGVPFGFEYAPPPGLPELITDDVELSDFTLGRRLPDDLVAAAQLAGYRQQYGLEWIKAIQPTPKGLQLLLTADVPVYFGDVSDRPDRKLAVLQTLWTSWRDQIEAGDHGVMFFDVRNPDRPLVRTEVEENED